MRQGGDEAVAAILRLDSLGDDDASYAAVDELQRFRRAIG